MKTYPVCDCYDEDILQKMCAKIEEKLPHMQKQELQEDVDGSKFQPYSFGDDILIVKTVCL